MKVAVLAGGMGTRLAEETVRRPKPMVEIGGMPILWHILKHYAGYGHRDFVIALGYRGDFIRRWFENSAAEPGWNVDLIDTGLHTNNGGRIKRLSGVIGRERFMLTWGDGVSDVDLDALLAFHDRHGRLATMTVVHPPSRFGHVALEGDQVAAFAEKPPAAEGWINGAFFVLEPEVFDYIDGDETQFEKAPMERLARDGQLMAFRHEGFWQCMDTIHEKRLLEDIWARGDAPWATWEKEGGPGCGSSLLVSAAM